MTYGKRYGLTLRELEEASVATAINARHNAVKNPLATLSTIDLLEDAKRMGTTTRCRT